jgi:hypothetical protein
MSGERCDALRCDLTGKKETLPEFAPSNRLQG